MPITELNTYLRQIDALLEFDGTKVTDQFTAIRSATEALIDAQDTRADTAQKNLVAAVTSGEAEHIPALLDAVATSTIAVGTPVFNAQHAALAALKNEYALTAADNHATVAAAFNREADALRTAANTVNLGLTADEVLPLTKKQQDAWQNARTTVRLLNALTEQLIATAEAAGADLAPDTAYQPGDTTIGLVVDPGKAHRRRLWEAWDGTTPHPLGKWGALINTPGATITARPLHEISPIPRPRPIETRQKKVLGDPGDGSFPGITLVQIDPEDEGYEELEESGFNQVANIGNNKALVH